MRDSAERANEGERARKRAHTMHTRVRKRRNSSRDVSGGCTCACVCASGYIRVCAYTCIYTACIYVYRLCVALINMYTGACTLCVCRGYTCCMHTRVLSVGYTILVWFTARRPSPTGTLLCNTSFQCALSSCRLDCQCLDIDYSRGFVVRCDGVRCGRVRCELMWVALLCCA